MTIAGYMVIHRLPAGVGWTDILHTGGKAGKLNIITTGFREKGGGFDWSDRYNLLSGVIGGFFLALSYFGTDQSQVGRYLTARSLNESRVGLLLNGLVKVPMQFLILLLGVMVFTFYQYNREPIFFNQSQLEVLAHSKYKDSLAIVTSRYEAVEKDRLGVPGSGNAAVMAQRLVAIKKEKDNYKAIIRRWLDDKEVGGDSNDTNYIFLRFVTDYLPKGLIGLLIAVIFLAAWGSIAATLNSLSSCTIMDFHKRFSRTPLAVEKEYRLSRLYTLFWGIFCVAVAQLAYNLGNSLIEAVNVLGSLFYGVILGIFLVAFYRKRIGGHAVFISAIIVEIGVIVLNVLSRKGIVPLSFLWFNVVGAVGVVVLSEVLQTLFKKNKPTSI
jgi:Na+/proline symporter